MKARPCMQIIDKKRVGTLFLLTCMLVTIFFAYGERENLGKIDIFHFVLPFVPLYLILGVTAVMFVYALLSRGKRIDIVCLLLIARMVLHCIPLLYTGFHPKFAVNFVTSGLCLAFYYAGLNFSEDKRFLLRVLKAIFLLIALQTAIEAVISPASFFGDTYVYKNQLMLPFGGSNAIAAILIPCYAFIFCAEKKWAWCIADTVILLLAVGLTKSRGGLIVAVLAICLALFFRLGISLKWIPIFLGGGVAAAALLLTVLMITPFGRYIFLNSSSTVDARFALWERHLRFFLEQPIFGYGFSEETVTLNPHNFFVHILSRSGVVGLLLFSVLVAFVFCKLVGALHDRYVKAGIAFLVTMACHSLVEVVLFSYHYDMIFWFILGGTVMRAERIKKEKEEPLRLSDDR